MEGFNCAHVCNANCRASWAATLSENSVLSAILYMSMMLRYLFNNFIVSFYCVLFVAYLKERLIKVHLAFNNSSANHLFLKCCNMLFKFNVTFIVQHVKFYLLMFIIMKWDQPPLTRIQSCKSITDLFLITCIAVR